MKFDLVAGNSGGALNGVLVSMNEFDLLESLWVEKIAKHGASEIYDSPFIDSSSKSNSLKFKLDFEKLKEQFKLQLDLNLSLFDKIGLIISKAKRQEIINRFFNETKQAILNRIYSFRSIADNSALRLKLIQYLDRSKIKDTKFMCGFVSLNSGIYHSVLHDQFCTDQDFLDGVIASTSMPVVWRPIEKVSFYNNGQIRESLNNVDGGLMNVSPLGDVISEISNDTEECKYKIIIINCNSGVPKYQDFSKKSIGGIAARSIYDLSLTEIFKNDLSNFLNLNDVVKQVNEVVPGLTIYNSEKRPIKAFDAVVIGPDKNFDLGNPLIANEAVIRKRMDHGFKQAQISL